MKNDELIMIKNEAIRLYSLLNERRQLEILLENKKGSFAELKELLEKFNQVSEKLWPVHSASDIPSVLEGMAMFKDIKNDTNKKLYYLMGFVKEDEEGNEENYDDNFDKYLIHVQRDSKLDVNIIYYAIYLNIVDSSDMILVCLQDRPDFENSNFIIDDGIDMSKEEYYKHRVELFSYLINAKSEEEAVGRLVLKHKKTK